MILIKSVKDYCDCRNNITLPFIDKEYKSGEMVNVFQNVKISSKFDFEKLTDDAEIKAKKDPIYYGILGDIYYFNFLHNNEEEKAYDLYAVAAKNGDIRSMYYLAKLCFKRGEEAIGKSLLEKAFDGNEYYATKGKIIDILSNGVGVAESLFRRALEMNDYYLLSYMMTCYCKLEDYKKAAECLNKLSAGKFPYDAVADIDFYRSFYKKASADGLLKYASKETFFWYAYRNCDDKRLRKKYLKKAISKGMECAKKILNKDTKECKDFFSFCLSKQLVEAGDSREYVKLGDCYFKGLGTEKSYEKAVELYNLAERLEFYEVKKRLGYCYEYGLGVKTSYIEAIMMYKDYLDSDDLLYEFGIDNEDFLYEEKAAYLLARLYLRERMSKFVFKEDFIGTSYIPNDPSRGIELLKIAVDLGYLQAATDLGEYYFVPCYKLKRDCAEAAKWFEIGAKDGNVYAMIRMYIIYAYGPGVKKDIRKALDYLFKACDLEDREALNYLDDFFEVDDCEDTDGHVETKDIKGGLNYLLEASEQGNTHAMRCLWNYFMDDTSPDYNPKRAMDYLKKASSLGNVYATLDICRCYAKGIGVEKDYEKAINIFKSNIHDNKHDEYLQNLEKEYEKNKKKMEK